MGLNWTFVVWGTANFAIGLAVGSHYWDRYHQKRNQRIAKSCRAMAIGMERLGCEPKEAIKFVVLVAQDLEQS